ARIRLRQPLQGQPHDGVPARLRRGTGNDTADRVDPPCPSPLVADRGRRRGDGRRSGGGPRRVAYRVPRRFRSAVTNLAELSPGDIPATRPIRAVPLGSSEQHGAHLPLGTDTVVAAVLAARLSDRCPDVVV